jgi:RNA polymerase sigma factor (sigma-70 family)
LGEVLHGDDELVGLALGGDLRAFGTIVRRYQDSVYATALRRTGNAADAEDVAQEAFLAAYENLSGLKEPAKLGGWLRSVTRYTYSNWRRKHPAAKPIGVDVDLAEAVQCQRWPRPDEAMLQEELRQRILDAVASLPQRMGEVVRLYYVDGFSYQDISDVLSMSMTTVKGRLQMGRDLLRKELIDMMEDALFKELLEKAEAATKKKGQIKVWENDMKESLTLVEQALARAGELGTARERDTARMHALLAKAQYLPNTDDDAQRQVWKESIELARKLKDHAMVGRLLVHTIFMRPPKDPLVNLERVEEAAGEFRKAGDENGEGQALLWKGIELLKKDRQKEIGDTLDRAQEQLVKSKDYAWAAVCDAAREFVGGVGCERDATSMQEYGWVAEMLRREEGGAVSYVGQPGSSGGRGQLLGSPVHDAAVMEVLVDDVRRVGEKWSVDSFSYGSYPMRTTGTVVSDCETVTVPAGTFTDCRLIRTVTEDPEPEREEKGPGGFSRLNEIRLGTREAWYARGVGLIKVRVDTERTKEDPPVFALAEFSMKEESRDWFPLAVGNRWTYVRENLDKEGFAGAHTLEVRYLDEKGIYYLSHCIYGYLVGTAAEEEARVAELEKWAEEKAEEANICLRACQWDEAAAGYEEVLAEYEDHTWSRMMAGRIYFMQGKYDRALEHLQRVPDVPWGVQTLGWCCDALGKREEAIGAYQKALEIAQQDSVITAAKIGLEEPYERSKKVAGEGSVKARELSAEGWTATASPHSEDAGKAFNGQKFSRWSTLEGQQSGEFYQLDLGEVELVNGVVLIDDADGDTIYVSDYARDYEIKVSADGEDWTMVASGKGDPRYYPGGYFEPVEVRYIRIDQQGKTRPESWSIYGIRVYTPEGE